MVPIHLCVLAAQHVSCPWREHWRVILGLLFQRDVLGAVSLMGCVPVLHPFAELACVSFGLLSLDFLSLASLIVLPNLRALLLGEQSGRCTVINI